MMEKDSNTGKEFDYAVAVEELEKIARKVEDPDTGLDDIDKYIKTADELIGRCRSYLRTAREKLDSSGYAGA